jgi:hypothetical protein
MKGSPAAPRVGGPHIPNHEEHPMSVVATPATATASARILDMGSLTAGTVVEARRRGEVHYRGCVEDAAPGLGVVWVRDTLAGHRAILHLDDYSIWRVTA